MNIYDYLKADHKKVSTLFKQFEDTKTLERRQQIVSMIADELLWHAHAEEAVFYKKLDEYPSLHPLIQHSTKEHEEMEQNIDKVLHFGKGKTWENDVLHLKKLVEHHVSEEENKIFKKAQEVLSSHEAYSLKEQMHTLKHKLKEKDSHHKKSA